MNQKKASPVSDYVTNNQEAETTDNLKDLISKGVAQSCTFDSGSSNGSVYISGGKVRGDFDVVAGGQTVKSHMLVMDSTSYIWTDGQKTGFKMTFDPNADTTNKKDTSAYTKQGFDPNADNNYKCSTWVTDNTKFTLPSDVTFSSFDIPKGTGSTTSGSSASQCAYCNALSGDDKTQCLTALKCN